MSKVTGDILTLQRTRRSGRMSGYPTGRQQLPVRSLTSGRYTLRFAQSADELEAIFRLRYRVFNLELNEGLDASHEMGLDIDDFDPHCHHMYVIDERSGDCVGTYRLQSFHMASEGIGFYSATEFDFSMIPASILRNSIEAGRACIDANHRKIRVLHLLWQGLGSYLSHNKKRYLFGCCSLTSQNDIEGLAVLNYLRDNDHMLQAWEVQPRPGFACADYPADVVASVPVNIPRLMTAYLSQGAKICGPPAVDRSFKTIDYLALFDVKIMSESATAFYNIRG